MYKYSDKKKSSNQISAAHKNRVADGRNSGSAKQLVDNRPETLAQQRQNSTPPVNTHNKPSIQRSKNSTGLPDDLKMGIENLSGYSMDDVNVHFNSDKPAQLSAHAFAQGKEIHLASGQEQHLPHEAWHVVQQKQGRVGPSRQLNTPSEPQGKTHLAIQLKEPVNINDDASLEHEADVMGARALSPGLLDQAQTHARSTKLRHTDSGTSTQRRIIQKISTQIVMKGDQIGIVIIRGRPPRTFSNSMGDHTTAFTTHVEGLNIALQGKNIGFAINYLKKLNLELKDLPGYEFLENSPSSAKEIQQRFYAEQDLLSRYVSLAEIQLNSRSTDLALNYIQLAINSYLDARELIPFSTINVAARSQGKAGKGHGEASAIAVLSTYERDPGCGIDQMALTRAVYKLFDDQSASMLAVENNPVLAGEMTAGVSFGKGVEPAKKLQCIWEQHRQSIEARFPKVYEVIGGDLDTSALFKNLSTIQEMNFLDLLGRTKLAYDHLERSLTDFIQFNFQRLSFNYLEASAQLYEKIREIRDDIAELNRLDQFMKGKYQGNISRMEADLKQLSGDIERNIGAYNFKTDNKKLTRNAKNIAATLKSNEGQSDSKTERIAIMRIGHMNDFRKGNPLKDFTPRETLRKPEEIASSVFSPDKKDTQRLTSVATTTLSSQMQSMSIQIELNEDGTIAKMLSSGRPESPFSGTMGAHTTSWVVHLDRVRATIVGKSLAQATADMLVLLGQVKTMAENLVKSNKSNLGLRAKDLYDSTLNDMTSFENVKHANSGIGHLQRMINATLSLYNLLPGVTMDKINTSGHGEGTFRKRILLYERYGHGSSEKVKEAMNGLFDGSKNSQMFEYHEIFLKQAYPQAYGFVTGKSSVEKIDIPHTNDINTNIEFDDTPTELTAQQMLTLYLRENGSGGRVHLNSSSELDSNLEEHQSKKDEDKSVKRPRSVGNGNDGEQKEEEDDEQAINDQYKLSNNRDDQRRKINNEDENDFG